MRGGGEAFASVPLSEFTYTCIHCTIIQLPLAVLASPSPLRNFLDETLEYDNCNRPLILDTQGATLSVPIRGAFRGGRGHMPSLAKPSLPLEIHAVKLHLHPLGASRQAFFSVLCLFVVTQENGNFNWVVPSF